MKSGSPHNKGSKKPSKKKAAGRKTAQGLAARALGLSGLIGYQENSIVSKAIISRPRGNVTLFAFDKGQGLSEHTVSFDAMVYIIDGRAQITIAGRPLRPKRGEVVIMPADKPHSLKAINRFKMLLVMIKS